jgi:hypothetical protein
MKNRWSDFHWINQCDEDRQSRILAANETALHVIPRGPNGPAKLGEMFP